MIKGKLHRQMIAYQRTGGDDFPAARLILRFLNATDETIGAVSYFIHFSFLPVF